VKKVVNGKRIFILFFLIFPQIALSQKIEKIIEGRIKKEGINIRVDSTVNSLSLGKLRKNEKVKIVREKYEWYRIILPSRFTCFVASCYLKKLKKDQAKCIASSINVRCQPSLKSIVVGKLKRNDIVKIQEYGKEWSKISCYPYGYGWVHKNFIELASSTHLKKKDNINIKSENKSKNISISSGITQPPLAEGIFKKLRKKLGRDINYFIENRGGIIPLKVNKHLNPEFFLNRKVKVWGKFKANHYIYYIEVEKITAKK